VSREQQLARLDHREEEIRFALEYPSGVMRPGGYIAHYSRTGCLRALGVIAAERARLRAGQSRQAPVTAPAVRTSRPGRPARSVRNRRKTLKLSAIIAVADVAVVAYVEKGLIAGHAATAGHRAVPPAQPEQLIFVGLVFGSPVLLILIVAWLFAASKAKARAAATAAPRPVSFGQYGGRP
jgi:hypothetical protein